MENIFCTEYLRSVLKGSVGQGLPDKNILYSCAMYHYHVSKTDDIAEKYRGDVVHFFRFLEDNWNWKIEVKEQGKKILIDEGKNECICPVIKELKEELPAMCFCSEAFEEKMFSEALGQKVSAKVIRSFLRDKETCLYEITLESPIDF